MKKIFAAILLLCHMNTSMFLPQVAEDDVYDKNGVQVDDINSVVEFFEVQLGYDNKADDEDTDSGQNFHLAKTTEYNFRQAEIIIVREEFAQIKKHAFAEYKMPAVSSPSLDIPTPPPNNA